MTLALALLAALAAGAGAFGASFLVEALRRRPTAPERLRWAPDVPIRHVEVDGCRIRYIKVGEGPALVLLHTLRTQLDLFEKVVPELAASFTVYAFDYPGHGFSDIPKGRYDARFFADAVEGFLEELDLLTVTLAGVSIGASVGMLVAARRNPRVARVVAINLYDYDRGRGLARSSFFGWLITTAARIPVVGGIVFRLRNQFIVDRIFAGGVADRASLPQELLDEMYLVGNRPGHYQAFRELLRNAGSWEEATATYPNIEIPVLMVWGDQDWARPQERERDRKLVPGAEMVTVARSGHFLPLDRPDRTVALIVGSPPD